MNEDEELPRDFAQSREDLKYILDQFKGELKRFGVRRIGFYGSFARDEVKERSDLNLVIELGKEKIRFENISRLVDYLEALLGRPLTFITPAGIENIRMDWIKKNIEKEVVYVPLD